MLHNTPSGTRAAGDNEDTACVEWSLWRPTEAAPSVPANQQQRPPRGRLRGNDQRAGQVSMPNDKTFSFQTFQACRKGTVDLYFRFRDQNLLFSTLP